MTTSNIKITVNKKADLSPIARLIERYNIVFGLFEYLEDEVKKYGDVYIDRNGSFTYVLLSNPPAIERVFTADPNRFETGKFNRVLEPLLGANSLVLLDGVEHQKHRKLLMPSFHGESMKSYGEIITDITKQVIAKWQRGKPFKVRQSTQ